LGEGGGGEGGETGKEIPKKAMEISKKREIFPSV